MTGPGDAHPARQGRRPWLLAMFAALLAVAFTGFVALGVWQLQRMAWKRDLIARVDARVHAAPVPAPARARWPSVSEASDAYRHVSVAGRFATDKESRTQAVTALGAGYWSMVPLRTDAGDYVLINRGFVPVVGKSTMETKETRAATPPPDGRVVVTGLLRISEPGGGFLRRNDPARQRWYSRDVAAIARSHGLPADRVAPFFIDADRDASSTQWPRGGLTVVKFRDSHLSYAVTWFAMALLTLVAGGFLFASERRLRHDRRR
ncbi:SURF1 family protein [Lysobacter arvi]|uniref:SURF1-like protein n=1 Tax=Lysobacter arvi TaxID=3038776 RepID=A0ABU1CCF8_9GAMM|nr:SURF1 family protein [Lysobacter arvi]MDR0182094.1 SURF1 family protein [Lysobacter arvi]